MADHDGPAAVGGLIVRNGKYRGTRVPLKLPVTVIGKGEGCDIRLTGEGIAPLHCVIAVTPAGPTVRAWVPDATFVNGHPTAAAVLSHGDELKVGPCSFRFSWFGNLDAAEPEEPAHATGGADWTLREREQALHEQEVQLATLLDARQRQVEELLTQLTENRESFQRERDAARTIISEARRSKTEAEQSRARAHTTYRRLMARLKRTRKEQLAGLKADRSQLATERAKLNRERDQFDSERTRYAVESESIKQRLSDAWAMLSDGQKRLQSDRLEAERWLNEYRATLDRQAAELAERDGHLEANCARLEARVQELTAEIAGLDQRANHARLALADVEQQRLTAESQAATTALATAAPPIATPVPLDHRKDWTFDQLVADLTQREAELDRDQKALANAKSEIHRQLAELADQRAVLAEQFAKLAAAARSWQVDEGRTVDELERIAMQVEVREKAVASREQKLLDAESSLRNRQRELWDFRVKLEGWQAALTAHESQWYAQRDRQQAELDRRRDHLANWETSLESLCRTWNDLRAKERDRSEVEFQSLLKERQDYVALRSALDQEKAVLATRAAELAILMTSTLSAADEVPEKRLRVVRKRWESHFRRFEKAWQSREQAAQRAGANLDARMQDVHRTVAELRERIDAFEHNKRLWEAGKLTAERKAGERETRLAATTEQTRRTETELKELRSEVNRVAAALMSGPPMTGAEEMIALLPARAA